MDMQMLFSAILALIGTERKIDVHLNVVDDGRYLEYVGSPRSLTRMLCLTNGWWGGALVNRHYSQNTCYVLD